jgi:hypothetical protein
MLVCLLYLSFIIILPFIFYLLWLLDLDGKSKYHSSCTYRYILSKLDVHMGSPPPVSGLQTTSNTNPRRAPSVNVNAGMFGVFLFYFFQTFLFFCF